MLVPGGTVPVPNCFSYMAVATARRRSSSAQARVWRSSQAVVRESGSAAAYVRTPPEPEMTTVVPWRAKVASARAVMEVPGPRRTQLRAAVGK